MDEHRSRLLAVDIGNTDIRVGLFDGDSVRARWSLAADATRQRDDYGVSLTVLFAREGIEPRSVDQAVVGSVVPPLLRVFDELIREYFGIEPLIVRTGVRTGSRLVYDPVFEIGADRIANAVAAHRLYGSPAVVVDFGTATTFDAIGPGGSYLGGAIAPGLAIAADALWQRTAQLHRIGLEFPDRAIGRNTVEAVQSGLLFGYVGLAKEMIGRFRAELNPTAHVIATGALAPVIAAHVPPIDRVDLDLTLHGLRLIHQLNVAAPIHR